MKQSNRTFLLLFCMIILSIVLGCSDERKTKIDKGISFIRSCTNTNPVQSLATANYEAGTPEGMIALYHASLPADSSYPNVYSDRQSLQSWSLLILPGNKENSLIVEGYGDDLTKPLVVEEIIFKKLNNP